MTHPWAYTMVPLHMAQRMIEARGGTWRIEEGGQFLEVLNNSCYLGSVLISDEAVRYLDVTGALSRGHQQ